MSPLATTQHSHNPRKAIILKLVSVFMFSLMAGAVKLLEGKYPTNQLVFARAFFGLFPLIPLVYSAGLATLRPRRISSHLIRGTVGITAMCLTFYALPRLPLATFTTISFSMPLFVAVLAALYLKEKLTKGGIAALIIGFIGVLVVLRPPEGFGNTAALVAIASAFMVAVVTVVIRQLTATENSLAIVFWFTTLCAASSGALTLFYHIPPISLHDGLLLVASGLFGGTGQVLLTQSYRFGQVSSLAVLEYTGLVWAILISFLSWGETPDLFMLAGAAIIIGAGSYTMHNSTHGLKKVDS